ncbi:flagellin N-methylase [Paraburkholderia adhaesiva]|uniref:flagellin N-methylase n=1 Tax=Paraburkholderia adhaesiva TaxID=2883244 RepID=UPI001F45B99E|nr:flagellin N-methylase [Paraburkholderia adhaesiva]
MVENWSLACNACGKCCNSPPALSLRELFRHRERFIGCIAVSRVFPLRTGARLGADASGRPLDADEAAASEALAHTLFHRLDGAGGWLSVTLQGYDDRLSGRCPALAADGRCTLHDAGKPDRCEAVPLDPLLPDRLQPHVLRDRRESMQSFGAVCIRPNFSDGATPLIRGGRVADTTALERSRHALVYERNVWRDAVFASLCEPSSGLPSRLAMLAPGVYLTLPIVPALFAVARFSARCREACIELLDSQIALIDARVAEAIAKRRLDLRPVTRELRGFAEVCERAKSALRSMGDRSQHGEDPKITADVEAWLGLADDAGFKTVALAAETVH